MSRSYFMVYEPHDAMSDRAHDLWDKLFDDCEEAVGLGSRIIQSGSASGRRPPNQPCDILLWGNRAKLRRAARKLDAYFGGPGTMTVPEWGDDDE